MSSGPGRSPSRVRHTASSNAFADLFCARDREGRKGLPAWGQRHSWRVSGGGRSVHHKCTTRRGLRPVRVAVFWVHTRPRLIAKSYRRTGDQAHLISKLFHGAVSGETCGQPAAPQVVGCPGVQYQLILEY